MSADSLTIDIEKSFDGYRLKISETFTLDGVTAVFGPSGSGKSTLLRLIAGFETPDRGRIQFNDEIWFDSSQNRLTPAHERPVGYMFQDARLFPHLSVGANLAYADKRSAGASDGFATEDVVGALELGDLLDRRAPTLSGGEHQRVALARTLLARPRLLLLDEPLAAVDENRKSEILPYLDSVRKTFRLPTFYVSHAISEVASLADHMLVIANGEAQAFGATIEIVERLELDAVTGRFEAGALADVPVSRHDERLQLTYVELGGGQIAMPLIDRARIGDQIRIRIRARDVALATQRPQHVSIRNVLPGRLTKLAAAENSAYVEAFVDIGGVSIRARITRAALEELRLAEGQDVFALIKTVSFDRRLS